MSSHIEDEIRGRLMRGRFVKAGAVLGVNLVLLSLGIVGLELAFGKWFLPYVPPQAAIIDRTMKFQQSLYDPPSEVIYTRDRHGLRGAKAPIDQIELVTVGGSTTDQRYINDGQTWQDLVHTQTGIKIANAGVDGMSSTGHLIAVSDWLYKIPTFRPKYYLHYMGGNDAALRKGVGAGDRRGTSSWSRTLRNRSAIIQAMNKVSAWSGGPTIVGHARTRLTTPIPPAIRAESDRDELREFIDAIYKPNLRQLLELHRKNGELVILVSQPSSPLLVIRSGDELYVRIPGIARWAIALDMINAATEAVCREHVDICRFIDLAGRLQFDPADFYDFSHATPAGAYKIGSFLAQELTTLRQRDHW